MTQKKLQNKSVRAVDLASVPDGALLAVPVPTEIHAKGPRLDMQRVRDGKIVDDQFTDSTDELAQSEGLTPAQGELAGTASPIQLAQATTESQASANSQTAISGVSEGAGATAASAAPATVGSFMNAFGALGAVGLAGIAVGGGGAAAAAAVVQAFAQGGIVAGPVVAGNDLVVRVYKADGTTLIGTGTVDATGHYSVDLHAYTGPVIARLSSAAANGTPDYLDEASGQPTDLDGVMLAVGVATANGLTLYINPLTTMAAQLAGLNADGSGHVSDATSVTHANELVASAFGLSGSLIAPASLVPVVSASGTVNPSADAYGKVLAALSGVDELNGGMQASIAAFVQDLSANGGTLSAESKFALIVGAQDPDIVASAGNIASAVIGSVNLSVSDISAVLGSQSEAISGEALAGALRAVLGNPSIAEDNLQDLKNLLQDSSPTSLNNLATLSHQVTGLDVSFGDWLNRAESRDVVTLNLHSTSAVAGSDAQVTISGNINGTEFSYQTTLPISGADTVVTLPQGMLWDQLPDNGSYRIDVRLSDNTVLTRYFEADFYLPANFRNGALEPAASPYWGYANALVVNEPYDWNAGDRWQYRVGDGEWTDGPAFENGSATLHLAEGYYAARSIALRGLDDAGNMSTARTYGDFTIDLTPAELTINGDGTVQMNEVGAALLIADDVIGDASPTFDALLSIIQSGSDLDKFAYAEVGDNAVNQSLTLHTTGNRTLAYGDYHYYAFDYAGNVTRFDTGVTLENEAPQRNADIVVTDQTMSAYSNWQYQFDQTTFTDTETLTWSATLANGDPLPAWLHFDADSLVLSGMPVVENVGAYEVKLTATDSFGLSSSQTVALSVTDLHSTYSITYSNDSWSASATDADGNAIDSGLEDAYYTGGDALSDIASVTLDNGSGTDVTQELTLVNFSRINIHVVSDTTLQYFSSYGSTNWDYGAQTINIQADGDLTLQVPQGYRYNFDTADQAPVTINVAGAGDVDLGLIDGTNYSIDEGQGNSRDGCGLTLDAHALTGDLVAAIRWSSDNTIIAGAGDDRITVGLGDNTLTGGAGHDSFRISGEDGVGQNGAHTLVTDFDNGSDVLDLQGVTYHGSGANVLNAALEDGTNFASGVDTSVYSGSEGQYIYVDLDQDGVYQSNSDLTVLLAGVSTPLAAGSLLHSGGAANTYDIVLNSDALTATRIDASGHTEVISAQGSIYGDASLADVANISLDNGSGVSDAEEIWLGNFETINMHVVSNTSLGFFSSYESDSSFDYRHQTINIVADADLTVSDNGSYTFDTADSGAVTINVSGSGNVDLGNVDGTNGDGWVQYEDYFWHGEGITLDAHALTGDLTVNVNYGDNTIIGGTGNDYLRVSAEGFNVLTGGAGNDTFVFAEDGQYAPINTITDFGNGSDVLDLTGSTDAAYGMDQLTEAMTEGASFASGIDVSTWTGSDGAYVYVDSDHNGMFNVYSDLKVYLQGVSTAMDASFVHA